MMLRDTTIATLVDPSTPLRDRITIEPFEPTQLQPASYDVRLDRHFLVFDTNAHHVIDPASPQPSLTRPVDVGDNGVFTLQPGQLVLGSTYETVAIPTNLAVCYDGRSSMGRIGLLSHVSAGYIDPGFRGNVTLELRNVGPLPIELYAGMRVGQLRFLNLDGHASRSYGSTGLGSHYQGQRGPKAAVTWRGWSAGLPDRTMATNTATTAPPRPPAPAAPTTTLVHNLVVNATLVLLLAAALVALITTTT